MLLRVYNNTLFTILAAVAAVKSGVIDAVQRLHAGAMPQRPLILHAWIGFVHLGLAYHVLLVQPRILNAFNLTTTKRSVQARKEKKNIGA